MADPDPWAAFNPQPAPASPVPVIPDTPAPQTPAQAQDDANKAAVSAAAAANAPRLETAKANEAEANATIAKNKSTEEGLNANKQQAQQKLTIESARGLIASLEKAKGLVTDANGVLGNTATGLGYRVFHNAPLGATDASRLDTTINDEIGGSIFENWMNNIKSLVQEGQGAGFGGRIMQSEIPMIKNAQGAITHPEKLTPSDMLNNLQQIEDRVIRSTAIMEGKDPDDPKVIQQYHSMFGATVPGAGTPPPPNGTPTGTPPGTPPSGPTSFTPDQQAREKAFIATNPTPEQYANFLGALQGGTTVDVNAAKARLDALKSGANYNPNIGPSSTSLSGLAGQFLDNTKNDVAGIAQGAAALPDAAAKGVGKVMSVVPTAIGYGLDKLGYGAAGAYAHGIAHDLANPFQVGNAVESIAPTPNTTAGKVNRTVGQIVGGVVGFPGSAAGKVVDRIVGEAPNAAFSIPEKVAANVVQDGKTAGVPVLTSDVRPPQTFIGKAAQAVGERVPITGTGPVRASQQTARVAAVKSAAQDFGAATGDELNSPAIDDVAADLAKQRGAQITRLTNQKNAVINGTQGAVPVPNTIRAISEQIARLRGINDDAYAPVITKLQDFGEQLASGKTLSQIEGNRKLLGDMFADPSLASIRGDGEKALSAIYGPLRDDMGSFIKANGNPGDFDKWKSANDTLAGMVGDLKNTALKRSLNTADTTPENVASLLFSSKPSDVRTLYSGLSPAGRAKAQAAIIQRAVEKSGGMDGLSPDRFANQIKSLGNSVGVFFTGDDAARLDGLSRVLKATQRASQAAVAPPTGVQAVPYAMGAGFTELFGIPGGLSAAMGTGLLARAYESAPVRNLLVKLGKSKPGTQQERFVMGRLGTAINAAIQKPSAAGTAINENMPQMGAAAASPNGGPNQQQ